MHAMQLLTPRPLNCIVSSAVNDKWLYVVVDVVN